ncbi:hypothetical protein O5169_27820, partial [Escherichia coli]|nr:hypothetical protein [Escherichia coli]
PVTVPLMSTPVPLPEALPVTALFATLLLGLPLVAGAACRQLPLPLTVVLVGVLWPLMSTPEPLPVAPPLMTPSSDAALMFTPVAVAGGDHL